MRVAFVTGAGGDIGRHISSAFLARGMAVAGADLDLTRLRTVAAELAEPQRFFPVQADVTQMDSVRAAVGEATRALGEIDVLVNNAGGITQPSLRLTQESDWLHD